MARCVALSVRGVKERRNIDGMRLERATDFLPQNLNRLFHEKRSTHCAINTTTFLAQFLAVVCVEIVQRDVHDVLVCVHHAADPEFSLRGDEE